MKVFIEFENGKQALAYRKEHGTGGIQWIFCTEEGPAFLFPAGMTPSEVIVHPLIKGLNGILQ